jgi:transposase
MEYFAGLDVSMKETHICVMDRDGKVALDAKAAISPAATAVELAKAPAVKRIVFETGRMAPALYHGLEALGLPVVCIENRHAYQALRSLATHKTDRNDARGLAHLARTGFFKPVHVKSLPSHAVRALIIARKKLVGQRVTIENQIRGLALVFGVRLPRGLVPPSRTRSRVPAARLRVCRALCRGCWRRATPCSVRSRRSTETSSASRGRSRHVSD